MAAQRRLCGVTGIAASCLIILQFSCAPMEQGKAAECSPFTVQLVPVLGCGIATPPTEALVLLGGKSESSCTFNDRVFMAGAMWVQSGRYEALSADNRELSIEMGSSKPAQPIQFRSASCFPMIAIPFEGGLDVLLVRPDICTWEGGQIGEWYQVLEGTGNEMSCASVRDDVEPASEPSGSPDADLERRTLETLAKAITFQNAPDTSSLSRIEWRMSIDGAKLAQLEGLKYSATQSARSRAVVFVSDHTYLAVISGSHPPSLPEIRQEMDGTVVIQRNEDEWCMPLLIHRTAAAVTYAAFAARVPPVMQGVANPGVLPVQP